MHTGLWKLGSGLVAESVLGPRAARTRGAAPRNDRLGWAVSDLGHRPFFGQTERLCSCFYRKNTGSRGCRSFRSRSARAREAQTDQHQAVEISGFSVRKTGENRRAKTGRQQFSAPAGSGQTSPAYGFMKRSGQEINPIRIDWKGTRRRAAPWLICQERKDR